MKSQAKRSPRQGIIPVDVTSRIHKQVVFVPWSRDLDRGPVRLARLRRSSTRRAACFTRAGAGTGGTDAGSNPTSAGRAPAPPSRRAARDKNAELWGAQLRAFVLRS